MKKAVLLSSLFACVFFLAGCGPTIVEVEPLRPIQQNSQQQTDQSSLQYSNQTGSQASTAPVPQTKPTTPTEETVKTLKDFTPITAKSATIKTNKGDIEFDLYADKSPLTVTNFLTLAKSKFYDGVKFHRIIADFMAQVGDPKTKDDSQKAAWGTGGPGYTIQDEFAPELKFVGEGVVAMANTGMPNTGGSQFFITFGDTTWLNGKHAIFGKVTKGMDVVRSLEIGDQILSISYK